MPLTLDPTITATPPTTAAALEELDVQTLGSLIDAVDERIDTAGPDTVARLQRGRARLALALARSLDA